MKRLCRYAATLSWRAAQRIDGLLQEPQPHFELIKTHYPHFYCARAKSGNRVYCERLLPSLLPRLERHMDNTVT
jgi:hypothetical protein